MNIKTSKIYIFHKKSVKDFVRSAYGLITPYFIKRLIKKGEAISLDDFEFQRPCPFDALKLNDIDKFIGKKIKIDLPKDEYLKYDHF